MRPQIALDQARGGGLLRGLAGPHGTNRSQREEEPRRGLAGALSLQGVVTLYQAPTSWSCDHT
jgi:hypothetical protein